MQDPKNRQNFAICAPPHTFSGYIFTTKAHIDNRKKTVKQQCLPHTFSQYGALRPTNGWDLLEFGAPQHISTGFASWQCYCTAL